MGNVSMKKFTTFLWAVEDQNETKNGKVSTSRVAQGKKLYYFVIGFSEIGRQN